MPFATTAPRRSHSRGFFGLLRFDQPAQLSGLPGRSPRSRPSAVRYRACRAGDRGIDGRLPHRRLRPGPAGHWAFPPLLLRMPRRRRIARRLSDEPMYMVRPTTFGGESTRVPIITVPRRLPGRLVERGQIVGAAAGDDPVPRRARDRAAWRPLMSCFQTISRCRGPPRKHVCRSSRNRRASRQPRASR